MTNLHVRASASGTEVIDTSHLGRKPNASRAVDATSHDCLDQGTHVFVFDGTFVGKNKKNEK